MYGRLLWADVLKLVSYVCVSGHDAQIMLWDVATGDLVGQLPGHYDAIYSLSFSREGTLLASGTVQIHALSVVKISWKQKCII